MESLEALMGGLFNAALVVMIVGTMFAVGLENNALVSGQAV
jgi:hypothetical protein